MGATSTLSRRTSEFAGVALFGASLIWLIALVTYEPGDPVWFFTVGPTHTPANFVGLVGAFVAEVSFQLLGYTSFLVPAILGVLGWNFFWCRTVDAGYTKSVGATLFVGCLAALFSLVIGNAEIAGRTFRAGGYMGEWIGGASTAYLNRPGSIIVMRHAARARRDPDDAVLVRPLVRGRLRGRRGAGLAAWAAYRNWREERRKEAQRREVIAKHTKKQGADPPRPRPHRSRWRPRRAARAKAKAKDVAPAADDDDDVAPAPAATPRRAAERRPSPRANRAAVPRRRRCRWARPTPPRARRSSVA